MISNDVGSIVVIFIVAVGKKNVFYCILACLTLASHFDRILVKED